MVRVDVMVLFFGLFAAIALCVHLAAKLDTAYKSSSFSVWNRNKLNAMYPGVERRNHRSLIFIDIDDMKKLNDTLGYQEVNRRITVAFHHHRDIIYQYFSGDELVVVCQSTEAKMIGDKIVESLRLVGIGCTWVHLNLTGYTVDETATRASELVLDKKRQAKDVK